MMTRGIPIAVAIIVVAAATVVQARWSERWRPAISDEQIAELVSRFDRVPRVIGSWENREDGEADPEQMKAARAAGSLSRMYVNRFTGAVANVFIVCGTGRNVSIHTPDKCYVAAGYSMRRNPEVYDILDAEEGEKLGRCFTAPFTIEEATAGMSRLRIYWTWNGAGEWEAPGGPATAKFSLARYDTLYKLYVITEIPSVRELPGENQAIEFMREFLPILNESFYPDAATEPAETAQHPEDPAEEPAAA